MPPAAIVPGARSLAAAARRYYPVEAKGGCVTRSTGISEDRGRAWLRALRRSLLLAACVAGAAAGAWALWAHLTTDPLADVRAYYDAGARLNVGLPLYAPGADTTTAAFYRYPPLLAIAFRPLALLPYPVAAVVWEAFVIAALVLTLVRLGLTRRTAIAVALLGVPIAWAVSIGQAQVPVTWLLALGAPWSVALAANLKILPGLVALYWIGRGDWRRLGRFVAWVLGLLALQFVLEPAGTKEFMTFSSLAQVGEVNNLSPYALSPALWAVLALLGAVGTVWAARRNAGWPAAVAYSVLVSPRLLSYMLTSLLAALAGPRDGARDGSELEPRSPGGA